MSLQNKTLERYRRFFPNDTLKEISGRTGLQLTRIHRLFNGKVMKVLELEAFENAINKKLRENPNHARLFEVLETASAILTNEEMAKVIDGIERKNLAKTYGRLYVRHTYENVNIA